MVFLFDIDGVLNKSDYFTTSYSKDFGIDPQIFSQFFESEFPYTLTNDKDLSEILPTFLKIWKWEKSVDEFLDYWFRNDVKLDRELLLLIRHYRLLGYRVGIVSQQERCRKEYLLHNQGLRNEFDCFYFSCDLGYLKSEANFYKAISEKESNPIYLWDDTPAVIEKAAHHNFRAYLYHDNQKLKQEIEVIIQQHEF